MGRTNAQEQMNMIGNATDGFGNDLQCFGRATQISVKAWAPCRFNQRTLFLGAEDDVDVQTEMR